MKTRQAWMLLLLLLAAGCGSVAAKPPVDGGLAGAGGSGHDGGGDAASTTVSLRIVLPDGRSFCDQTTGCSGPAHITIIDAVGKPVITSIPWCSTLCSNACQPSPCPGVQCFSQGIPVKTTEFKWDGSTFAVSTCGNKVTCYQPTVAPAGHYVAHMCATPGTIGGTDGGVPTCTATGAAECVDVPFDLPSLAVVSGTLP